MAASPGETAALPGFAAIEKGPKEEGACARADQEVGLRCLPPEIAAVSPGRKTFPVGTPLEEVTRWLATSTLDAAGGDRDQAARQLGVDPGTLDDLIAGRSRSE